MITGLNCGESRITVDSSARVDSSVKVNNSARVLPIIC